MLENHCPIWAAATTCQGFCTTELDLFRAVLGPHIAIELLEHIVSGDRRCAYRIKAKKLNDIPICRRFPAVPLLTHADSLTAESHDWRDLGG